MCAHVRCVHAGTWSLRTSSHQRRKTRSWTDWPLTLRRISGSFNLWFLLKGHCLFFQPSGRNNRQKKNEKLRVSLWLFHKIFLNLSEGCKLFLRCQPLVKTGLCISCKKCPRTILYLVPMCTRHILGFQLLFCLPQHSKSLQMQKRPTSAVGYKRPISQYARVAVAMGPQSRYRVSLCVCNYAKGFFFFLNGRIRSRLMRWKD